MSAVNVLSFKDKDELEALVSVARSYRESRLILEAVFESYTPYMGGGFDTSTLKQLEDGRFYITGFPTAKQVLGRMRWLAKVALVGRGGIDSLRDAEEKPEVLVNVGGETVRMGLLRALFGATPAQGAGGAWRSLVQVHVEPLTGLSYNLSALVDVADEDLLAGEPGEKGPVLYLRDNRFALLSRGATSMNLVNGKRHHRILDLDWGGGRKIIPLRPGAVKFKLKLVLDVNRLRRVTLRDGESLASLQGAVSDFLGLVALLTPTIFGLGKAATRGFGRFKLVNAKAMGGRAKEAISVLNAVSTHCTSFNNCEKQYRRLLELLSEAADELTGPADDELHLAPSLNLAISRGLVKVVPATLKPPSAGGYFSPLSLAIERIGTASMKHSWKRLHLRRAGVSKKPHTVPGLNVHTWPLGLPRKQKFPGGCADQKLCEKADMEALSTGYLIASTHLAKTLEEKRCISCGPLAERMNCVSTSVVADSLEEGRRQSMIVAFPAPCNGCKNSWPVVVVMLPARDFMDRLFSPQAVKKLLHSGPCEVKNKKKPCMTVVVDVASAAANGGKTFRVNNCRKRGGVATVNGNVDSRNLADSSDYSSVLEEAFKFFVETLRR